MTDTMTSQNIDLSSWDTLYIYISDRIIYLSTVGPEQFLAHM